MFTFAILTLTLCQAPTTSTAVGPWPTLADPQGDDLRLADRFIEQHLIDVTHEPFKPIGLMVGDRPLATPHELVDEVKLVPEAAAIARSAELHYRWALGLTVTALALDGLALGALFASLVLPAVVMPLLITALSLAGLAVVVALIALPFTIMYQRETLDAVKTYNHALVHGALGRPPSMPPPTGGPVSERFTPALTVPLATF